MQFSHTPTTTAACREPELPARCRNFFLLPGLQRGEAGLPTPRQQQLPATTMASWLKITVPLWCYTPSALVNKRRKKKLLCQMTVHHKRAVGRINLSLLFPIGRKRIWVSTLITPETSPTSRGTILTLQELGYRSIRHSPLCFTSPPFISSEVNEAFLSKSKSNTIDRQLHDLMWCA